jgi:hypothetical protein
MSRLFFVLLILCYVPVSAWSAPSRDLNAKQLFAKYQDSVYQIRVVELSSGNKTAIGSGFLISEQGHVATNYHVVSQYVLHPNRYRLEFVDRQGDTQSLDVVDIDVVHDLAVVKTQPLSVPYLALGKADLPKGARLFSLGNPHDLGMSVVEGTYNGLLEKAFYDKIFFSGSLNPGMSGGPALDTKGKVIGINVSTAGNQLSFLVPVHYLKKLLQHALQNPPEGKQDFIARIQQQLLDNQANNIEELLAIKWPGMDFAGATLPGKISEIFKCWGDTEDDTESFLKHSYSHCMSEDKIYLANYLNTGGVAYSYDLYTSRDLSAVHFYNLYSNHYGRTIQVNSAKKEDVSKYECHSDFTTLAGHDWKTAICARHYTKYPKLWDVTMDMALLSDNHQGLVIQVALAGVSKENALRFIKRFTGEMHWKK